MAINLNYDVMTSFDSTSDPVLLSHKTNMKPECYFTIAGGMGEHFPTNFDLWDCTLYIYMIPSSGMVSGTIQVWLYWGVSKSLVNH